MQGEKCTNTGSFPTLGLSMAQKMQNFSGAKIIRSSAGKFERKKCEGAKTRRKHNCM